MKFVPAEERRSRALRVFCSAESCVATSREDIATLRSYFDGGYEVWTVANGGEHQRLVHADDAEEDVERLDELGLVAHRFKLVCPTCGYDISVGDLLGMGVRAMAYQRGARRGRREDVHVPHVMEQPRKDDWSDRPVYASPARQRAMAALSKFADAGVSRLALTTLDRILHM